MAQERELPERSYAEQLQDNGIYVFMGEVDDESVKPVIEWILAENHVTKKKKKELAEITAIKTEEEKINLENRHANHAV